MVTFSSPQVRAFVQGAKKVFFTSFQLNTSLALDINLQCSSSLAETVHNIEQYRTMHACVLLYRTTEVF